MPTSEQLAHQVQDSLRRWVLVGGSHPMKVLDVVVEVSRVRARELEPEWNGRIQVTVGELRQNI